MFAPFATFLCVTPLAGLALAQSISFASPLAGASVKAETQVTIQLERPTPSTDVHEISLVISAIGCASACAENVTNLGTVLYTGVFSPQSTNSTGNQYETITVPAPNWLDGPAELVVAHFCLIGPYATPKLEFATTAITVSGSSG